MRNVNGVLRSRHLGWFARCNENRQLPDTGGKNHTGNISQRLDKIADLLNLSPYRHHRSGAENSTKGVSWSAAAHREPLSLGRENV